MEQEHKNAFWACEGRQETWWEPARYCHDVPGALVLDSRPGPAAISHSRGRSGMQTPPSLPVSAGGRAVNGKVERTRRVDCC